MEEEYDIVSATAEHQENIVEFLRQKFYKHEPLNVSIGAPPDRPIDAIPPLQFLSEGKCLLAVSRSERRILGFCANTEIKANADDKITKQIIFTEPTYNTIADFFNKIEGSVDIWKETGADRAVCIRVLGVDPAVYGRGIGRVLMEASCHRARSKGYPLIYVMCTSYYSARIARAMGMQCVYSLPYSEYKDEDGNPVFTPPQPHTEVAVFVQKLSSEA